MKLQDLPCDLCSEHLLCFFNEYHMLRMRFVSKAFAEWVWYYFTNNKTTFYIHIGMGNHNIGKIVDNVLIKMNRLKVIDLFTFDALDFLSLTDVGLYELGRLSLEELRLKGANCISGSFIVEWILNGSPLLESLTTLTLTNVKCEYFHLFKEFKNLEVLELVHVPSERSLNENEMNETIIGLPQSLIEFRSNYPLTHKNIEDIMQQCPNLRVLYLKPTYFTDVTMSLALSKVSENIEKFSLYTRNKHYNLPNSTNSYFSVFSSNNFSNLKHLTMVWKLTFDETILSLQKNLSLLSRTLESLNVVFSIEDDSLKYPLNTFFGSLCKLSKLEKLLLDFPNYFEFKVGEDILEQLKANLAVRTLKLFGGSTLEGFFDIVKSCCGQNLERLWWNYDRHIMDIEDNVFFFKDCNNLKLLNLEGRQFTDHIIIQNIQAIVNCKLEKVLGKAITASVIPHLNRDSLKVLHIEVNKDNAKTLKYLGEFKNLTKLEIHFKECIENYQEYTFPSNIKKLTFKDNLSGIEPGFTDLLFSVRALEELSFVQCKLQDDFIKDIIPLSDELDVLKIEKNVGFTHVSTEHFSKFTNCKVLLLECYDATVLSSSYSLFEQEAKRVTSIMIEDVPNSCEKRYPTIDFNDPDTAISYVRERVTSRGLREAYLALEKISESFSSRFTIEQQAELCKLFLVALQYEPEGDLPEIYSAMEKLWKEGKIVFDTKDIYYLEKAISKISQQVYFCIVANILMDLGRIHRLFNVFEYTIKCLYDLESGIEECTRETISRVLKHFIDGKSDICNFSGHVIVNTISTIIEDFPDQNDILEFIDLVIGTEFYRTSKKTFKELVKQKAKLDEEFEETETEIEPIPSTPGENIVEFFKEKIPQTKRDYSIHVANVKVPKIGPFNTSYFSEPFTEYGYDWVMEFLPDDEDETLGNCSIFLTLNSVGDQKPFDRIRIEFFISNFDLEPQSFLVHSRKFDMPESSFGVFVDKTYVEPYSTDDDFFIFKFIVGMQKVEEPSYKPIDNIEKFHFGRKELSSTNYPPVIHRWASEFPLHIHTLTFIVNPEDLDKSCYSDQFTAFGAKFSGCFNPLGVATKVKENRENSSLYLYLCSFDCDGREKDLESIKVKAVFANSNFDEESFYVFKDTFNSLTSSGSTVMRAYYQPKLIEINGKPYYEYVINCCLALVSKNTAIPYECK